MQQLVRVIRDPRNADRDYHIPWDRARELYEQGKLQWDLTNRCYTVPPDTLDKVK